MTRIQVPTVSSLVEARAHAHEYSSVLTAGTEPAKVGFQHPDHLIVSFYYLTETSPTEFVPPTIQQVDDMVSWGRGRENLLVHCNTGVSVSTATAWGVAIANGWDPEEAYTQLRKQHPASSYAGMLYARAFFPDELIISYLEDLFSIPKGRLLAIHEHSHKVDPWRPARSVR